MRGFLFCCWDFSVSYRFLSGGINMHEDKASAGILENVADLFYKMPFRFAFATEPRLHVFISARFLFFIFSHVFVR